MKVPARSGAAVFRYRGFKMVGVLNRPAGPEGRRFPAVLLLHGFPGAEKNADIQRRLLGMGVASFAPHFCGAWGSEGVYSFSGLLDQALAALRFLKGRAFVDQCGLAVFGFSMGGWAAIHLAARSRGLKAAAAVAPVGGAEMVGPDTREHVARLCRSLRVESVDSLTRDFIASVRRHDPAGSAARLSCPLLLVHGEADEVVPAAVSLRIFAAARGPKKLVMAPGAGHDFLDRRDWLTRLVCGWLKRSL